MGLYLFLGMIPPIFHMRVIIFNDTQNFNGSLDLINSSLSNQNKRFWDYKKYLPFIVEKIKSLQGFCDKELELKKIYFYEGKYNSKIINSFKWGCNQKIKELNDMISKEQKLLNIISQEKVTSLFRCKIRRHVEEVKSNLEEKKQKYHHDISKQKRNYCGQREFFKELEGNPLIEVKHTPLKQNGESIYQKGVDVLIATDMVNLAHNDAYDIAILLSGDTDLVEAVKLIESLGKTVIIFSYYDEDNQEKRNISDLKQYGKFVNIKNLSKDEIERISDLRKS